MIVIVEGVDGTGKTTLAQRIMSHLESDKSFSGCRYRHTGAPDRPVIEEYILPYLGLRPGIDHMVMDRLYWSNIVYAPKYRKRIETDETKRKFFDLFWAARGAVAVYCHQSPDVIHDRLTARGEDYTDLNDIPELLEAYDDVLKKTFLEAISLKLHEMTDYGSTINTIVDTARQAEKNAKTWNGAFPYFLGNPAPDVVICVGEDDSLLLSGLEDRDEENCLKALLTYVPAMAWHSTAVVNPSLMPPVFFSKLKKTKTVAVGRSVSDFLVRKRIPHGGIARPETVHEKFLTGWGNRVIDLAVARRIQIPGI